MRLQMISVMALALSSCAVSGQVQAELVLALTQNNRLVSFDSGNVNATSSVAITGLQAGDVLNGIDLRPFNNSLLGFATNGTVGRLYNIDRASGAASLRSTLDAAVNGSFFGVDFNPTVDRLRIVSNAGQNLRVNVDTGATLQDGALQYAAADVNAGTPPQVVAAAYTNNANGAVSTTLYGMDLSTQSLVTQSPPNNGTLNTIASLSSILFPEAAFDISGVTGIAYAIVNGFELATVNLATGTLTSLGVVNSPGNIIGIAAPVGLTAVPEPSSMALTAVGIGVLLRLKSRRKASIANSVAAMHI